MSHFFGDGKPTRRENPVAGVAPANSIEGFGGGLPKRTQTEFAPHPSTPLHQLVGNSAGGHASTSQKMPSHPVVANPATESKPTRAPAASWGMDKSSSPHDPASGDAILKEAAISGSARLSADAVHHSCIDQGARDCGD